MFSAYLSLNDHERPRLTKVSNNLIGKVSVYSLPLAKGRDSQRPVFFPLVVIVIERPLDPVILILVPSRYVQTQLPSVLNAK